MLNEFYAWLEQHSGITYDMSDDVNSLYKEMIFIDTFDWYISIENIISKLNEINDIIDTYGYDIPDEFMTPLNLKKMINSYMLKELTKIVNVVKEQLNFDIDEISSFEVLEHQVLGLSKLISFVKENDINSIIKNKLFDKYEDENDDMFNELFSLTEKDLSNIKFAIDDIRTSYFESLNDDNND